MRVFRQRYTDRKRATKQSKKWYVEFRDHRQVTRRLPGFTDKGATQELGRWLEKLVAQRVVGDTPSPELAKWLESMPTGLRDRLAKFGLLDSRSVASGKPLKEHVDDFHQFLLDKGNCMDYADVQQARVQKTFDGCQAIYFSDVSASKIQRQLAELRNNGIGIGNQTNNSYLQAVKQFCKWMIRDGRASESPVEHLTGMNAKIDRRRERRNLTAEELSTLLETAANGQVHHKLNGASRAVLYRVAIETGLRRKELATLKPSSFDFNGLTVSVIAARSKNRKPTLLPIRSELADELQQWFLVADIGPDALLWPKLTKPTADMVKRDLEAAGIPTVDESERVADFHSLRHSYVSLIVRGGVHPKIAQRLARHSDINLTMSRYSHTLLSDEAEGLEVLPQFPSLFGGDKPDCQTLRATGTDAVDTTPDNVLPLCLPAQPALDVISVQSDALQSDLEGNEERTADGTAYREKLGKTAIKSKNARGGTRTPMPFRALDPKSSAYANSATLAGAYF